MDRVTGALSGHSFSELPSLLRPGDLLVVNDTRVFPARLLGRRLPGGGNAECLLVRRLDDPDTTGGSIETWEALVHPGQRLNVGSRLEFGAGDVALHGEILDRRFHGKRAVRLSTDGRSVREIVDAIGHIPLPPYIKRSDTLADRERYQTVYARERGSIAAPTAGLHFTPELFDALNRRGIERTSITLHVGYGTFEPIRVEDIAQHRMTEEHFEVGPQAAEALSRALRDRRRVVAVGTSTTRTLESLDVAADGRIESSAGATRLFIRPGHCFRVVSGLITNFHLPRSSLLILVCAFAGRDRTLSAYRHAVEQRYRFYSYGDANLIL